jgi:hypothetical protein
VRTPDLHPKTVLAIARSYLTGWLEPLGDNNTQEHNIHQQPSSTASSMSTIHTNFEDPALQSKADVWYLKRITFNGKQIPIITQNFNG